MNTTTSNKVVAIYIKFSDNCLSFIFYDIRITSITFNGHQHILYKNTYMFSVYRRI